MCGTRRSPNCGTGIACERFVARCTSGNMSACRRVATAHWCAMAGSDASARTRTRWSPAAAIVRHRRWIVAAWVAAAALLVPAARRLEPRLRVAAHVDGSESDEVEHALAARFATPLARVAVLVATGVPRPDGEEGRQLLRALVDSLARVRGIARS